MSPIFVDSGVRFLVPRNDKQDLVIKEKNLLNLQNLRETKNFATLRDYFSKQTKNLVP